MQILFVCPYTPTPIRTRPYNLIRTLLERGHSVTLATLVENENEQRILQEFAEKGVRVLAERFSKRAAGLNVIRALGMGKPLQAVYSWRAQLAKRIVSEIVIAHPHFDVAHVEHLRGAQYGVWIQTQLPGHIPIVWDSVDCISLLFEQAAHVSRNAFGRTVTRFELPRTRRHEAWLVNQFPRVLVTSPKDKRALEELGDKFDARTHDADQIIVLPNGVDLDYFAPMTLPRDDCSLILTGKMSYHANATAAMYLVNDVMPRVWTHMPNVRVQIVGQNPPREVAQLAQHDPKRVSVTGMVDDLRPYLAKATIAVAPIMYGVGIQNKVLEAMAMQTPVVTTELSVSALNVRRDEHVLVGNSAEDLASAIVRLLNDPVWREQVGVHGRRYVEQNHNWKKIIEQLERIYNEVIRSSHILVS